MARRIVGLLADLSSLRQGPRPVFPIDCRNYLRHETALLLETLDAHERLRQRARDNVSVYGCDLLLAALDLILIVKEGHASIDRCRYEDCGGFFIEDRNVKVPAARRRYCDVECRNAAKQKRLGRDYFRQKQRESRARRD